VRRENVKMFEVRDEGTTIPVLAIKPVGENEAEEWLVTRAGYGPKEDAANYVILVQLDGCKATHDPYNWDFARTMKQAHMYIREYFDILPSGTVVDVQYILGESDKPKQPERIK
jgi:hypothetical protein